MACIYVLYSRTRKQFYKGSSRASNASSRLKEHNTGRVKSTKSGIPWEVLYEEQCSDYTIARKRENFLKSGAGRDWIKQQFVI